MKRALNVDCAPAEAREFLGQPHNLSGDKQGCKRQPNSNVGNGTKTGGARTRALPRLGRCEAMAASAARRPLFPLRSASNRERVPQRFRRSCEPRLEPGV